VPPDLALQELYDLQRFSIKMGLDNIRRLCNYLGNPQNSFPSIHIAGTNGKGSTAVMIQAILRRHGMKTGLYTSPHLVDFNERIRINDTLIDDQAIVRIWQVIRDQVVKQKATFFDATTAMAFQYFAEQSVDIGVIETGLGGRLDSTNILLPVAVVLTPIDRDHEKQLGSDYAGIAREKAAIIKDGVIVFSARQRPEAAQVLEKYRHQPEGFVLAPDQVSLSDFRNDGNGSNFWLLDRSRNVIFPSIQLSLTGIHQAANAALAYLTARWYLEHFGISFSESMFREAMASISWPGRLQMIAHSPEIIFDVSHNESGVEATLQYIEETYINKNRILLLGLLSDKNFSNIARRTGSVFNKIYVTEPISTRKMPAVSLQEVFRQQGIDVRAISSAEEAYTTVIGTLNKDDLLVVMGSHFLIGPLLQSLRKRT
jgi:dihydrofolate synthase/folylpolyglutamate synthase